MNLVKKIILAILIIVISIGGTIAYKKIVNKGVQVSAVKSNSIENRQAIVTFVDDDSPDTAYTKLKPLFDNKGIKGVIATVSGKLNTPLNLTTDQLLEMQNEGWEVAGHSVTHSAKLTEMSSVDAEGELKGCLEQLTSMGFKVNCFVYPWNTSNDDVQKIMKKYYKFGVGEIEAYPTNGVPLMTGELTRRNLGADFDAKLDSKIPGAVGADAANTLDYYKWLVDYAVSTKTWLIFVTHSSAMSGNQYIYLGQTVDYIKSIGVPIVTLSQGYEMYK